jgi:nucleoside-diphosphate-sugar epimerase
MLRDGIAEAGDISELWLIDQQFGGRRPDVSHTGVLMTELAGDFSRLEMLEPLLSKAIDVVFHLASVPGAQAEAEPAEGDRVNLRGTLALFERLAEQTTEHGHATRVVYASSVAVYGDSLPSTMDEHTATRPTISYGTHKLIGELLLADWTRRGKLNGHSLRLPGIVARPELSSGHGSAFMSRVFRAAQQRQAYTCPVSPTATAWWMSRRCCVDNLLHAACLPTERLHASRVWTPPVLHLSVEDVVDALVRRFGPFEIDYAPVDRIEQLFGRQPPLTDRRALEAGFRHDGTIDELVANALELA